MSENETKQYLEFIQSISKEPVKHLKVNYPIFVGVSNSDIQYSLQFKLVESNKKYLIKCDLMRAKVGEFEKHDILENVVNQEKIRGKISNLLIEPNK